VNAREDWEIVRRRWEAWWAHDLYDRVLVQVTAPRADADPLSGSLLPEGEVGLKTKWTDFDWMIRRQLESLRSTYFGGEAMPLFNAGWSVGWSLLFGCEPRFREQTVWVDPIAVGGDGYPEFHFSPARSSHNPWWQWYLDGMKAAAEASAGRYFVLPEMGNDAGDVLANVRGTEALLVDIALNPMWVKSAVETISDVIVSAYNEIEQIVSPEVCGVDGYVNDQHCWWSGRTRGLNCDVSCMVSPQAFRELFLPPLVDIMGTFERNVYHLDGPGALHHLDTLLDIPELDAIQWVPGAGHEAIMQWVPLIRRIQAGGKSICLFATPEEIGPLLREIRHQGVCISTHCESEAEARELIEYVEGLSSQGGNSG
jgi:hypothetical protein